MDNDQIPDFEGRQVDRVVTTLSAPKGAGDDLDLIVSMDDVVQVLGLYKVVDVGHRIDGDGNLVRHQKLVLNVAAPKPFNELNPDDDGVQRFLGKPGTNVQINGSGSAPQLGAGSGDDDGEGDD